MLCRPLHRRAAWVVAGLVALAVVTGCGREAIERCPTGAWDMQKFSLDITQAGPRCRDAHPVGETA